ncbi:hypothetical protein KG088_11355 [Halomonas sp. TRM85114]|uniref:FimV/HubP family polar landmark protein n=1 Tax=Halomonas jincaotanensis TaxID=2810616 RepID=UPI001BD351DC|nr:FimV/HubP family polar landmark protein [Halomonas jincaotanensis]MBS9404228.1 hypothetical protein [Halomonas jincaotanensis]
MKRKLTLAMLISLSATSHLAMALGVGDVEVRSTLNAPLRASIPLTDVAGLEPSRIKASIADARAYAAAGLDRTPLAASVRLTVSERGDRLILDMTSERAIREPWLDLLLRFEWPGGQQLREVTLLLDPPGYDSMPALVGGANAGRFAGSPSARRDTESSPRSAPRTSTEEVSSSSTRVSSGDTLWSVADRLRPDSGISMEQMMVALVEANPDVFPSGNINAMRAGFELVVPPRDAIAARSTADAQRIVQSMNQAWASRGSGTPVSVPLGDPQAMGEVAAAITSEESPIADAPARTEASVGSGDTGASGVAESTTEPAASDAQGARLTLLTDAQAAASRVSANVTEADGGGVRADGRNRAAGPDETGLVAGDRQVKISPDVLQALYGDGEMTRDARLLRLESQWAKSRDALENVRDERDTLQASLDDMRAEIDTMRSMLAALSAGGQGDTGPGVGGVVSPMDDTDQAADAPWWGALHQAKTDRSLIFGVAGLAALLALWALVRHRRRGDQAEAYTFDSVQAVGPQGDGVVSPSTTGRQEHQTAPVRASMPQAEAINEADIFIAYGRFDQARELLDASLEKEPERDDLRLKLLMVNLEQGNRQDAIRQAEHLEASTDPTIQAEVARVMNRLGESSTLTADNSDRLAEEDGRSTDTKAQATPVNTGEDIKKKADEAQEDTEMVRPSTSWPQPTDATEAAEVASDTNEPSAVTPELPSREDQQDSDIIDYQPPTLDPAPAARQETPMQPSIEFTSSVKSPAPAPEPTEAASSATESFFGNDLSKDWEVEEVAFPSLDQDNVPPAADDSSSDALDEARELLQAGDARQARSLLTDLAAADDATTREEAQSLLTRHDL